MLQQRSNLILSYDANRNRPVIARGSSGQLRASLESNTKLRSPARSPVVLRYQISPRLFSLARNGEIHPSGVNTFFGTRSDNVAGLFTSYEDSRWEPVIKLTEISRRVGGPIKSGRKSKTMVDRDIKGRWRDGKELSKFLWHDVFGTSHTGSLFSGLFCHGRRYLYVRLGFP